MTTNARIGYGTHFDILTSTGPDVWTKIGEQTNLKPPAIKVGTEEATHSASPDGAREFIPTLIDGDTVSFDINYVPGDATIATAMTYLRQVITTRMVFPNGYIWNISGILTDMSPDAPLDGKMVMSCELKVTGLPTLVAPSAPVNAGLPSIIYTALAEGDTLYAFPGFWSGSPTFTYVWKNAGSPISDATSQTYDLQASDSGDAITVTVTATNAAGSASATSPAVTGA